MRSQGRGGQVSGARWAVRAVVGALVLVAFVLPLRPALSATRAYVAGYWATAHEEAENTATFVWRSPHGEAVHGTVHGLEDKGYYDEALEPGQTLGPLRIWVSASGSAHVDEAPPESAMVFGYGASLAVAGATAYVRWAVRRARDPRPAATRCGTPPRSSRAP